MNKTRLIVLGIFFAINAMAEAPPPQQRNFIACPIMRDTQTVPCWLAEYNGELYYLGIQTDINADWSSPFLGHQVLVEGMLSNESRICGGIVLKPVRTSVLPELDASCNAPILPAEDQYTVPFAPRGPGPSKGVLAPTAARNIPPYVPPFWEKEFVVPYEFDWPWVTGKTAHVLQQVLRYAQASKAAHIEIKGYRAAALLSDGKLLIEKLGIAERRAKQVSELLIAVGIEESVLKVQWQGEPEVADGVNDFDKRRVTIVVKP